MTSSLEIYKQKITEVSVIVKDELSKTDNLYFELRKVANYDDSRDSLYLYREKEMSCLGELISHLMSIQSALAILKEFCNDEVHEFATFASINFDVAKDIKNVVTVLNQNNTKIDDIQKGLIIDSLSFNEKLRSTLHQLSAIMQNVISISGLERKFKLQERFPEKNILLKEELLTVIDASQMDQKRLERTWLELINLNSEDSDFALEVIHSDQLASYLSLQKEKLSNYYFFKQHKKILLVVDGLESFVFISDFDKIREIMDVILSNAAEELCDKEISEIDNGDEISHKQINISIQLSSNDSFTIRIKDNGRGISNTKIIFEPYFTTKKEKGGSGIGLAAAIKLVNLLGGSVMVNTLIGKGSTFYITFPLNQNNVFLKDIN